MLSLDIERVVQIGAARNLFPCHGLLLLGVHIAIGKTEHLVHILDHHVASTYWVIVAIGVRRSKLLKPRGRRRFSKVLAGAILGAHSMDGLSASANATA